MKDKVALLTNEDLTVPSRESSTRIPLKTLETFVILWRQTKLFKAVGAPTTRLVMTSGHSEKIGGFLSQKANWISSNNNYIPYSMELNSAFWPLGGNYMII